MYGIKLQIKFHGWCLFHPKYLRNFIHESSSVDDSWMITHECSSINLNIVCSTIMSNSLYLLPNSTSTRQHGEIVKFKFILWIVEMNRCIKCFWAVLCSSMLKFLPKKSNCLNASPAPLPPPRFFSPLLFFYLMALWSLKRVFQNSNYLVN